MGECVLVYGKSGSGKSRSLKGFGSDEILFINTINKRLPFPNKFNAEMRLPENSPFDLKDSEGTLLRTYTGVAANVERIKSILSRMVEAKGIYTAVVDDSGYLMTALFMQEHSKSNQFELYNQIGDTYWQLFKFVKTELPDEVIVYWMMHEDVDDFGNSKLRTIGKLLDQKVCLEGMVTICLHCVASSDGHFFLTNSKGDDICKSPEDMFEPKIANDLKYVDDRIREYWGLYPKLTKTADGQV